MAAASEDASASLPEDPHRRSLDKTLPNNDSVSLPPKTDAQYSPAPDLERGVPDAEGESALVRRLDLRIIPWIGLCYLFAYLDRSNIGNAVIAEGDMLGSLGIAPGSPEYSLALSIFFVGYLLFEIPSNILLKWATPSKWIARIMVTWGIVAACTAAVTNAAGLIAVRFFLGVAEAGFFPGVIYFFAFWYRQDEQARRISWFFGAVSLAGAFSGLLASAIGFLHGVGGLDAWQYLFIIEGVPSVILGILTIWMLPDFPGTGAKWFGREWLTPEEDALAASRMAEHAPKASDPAFDWIEFKELFSNPSRARTASTYLLPLIYFAFACGNYSISFYLPTVVLSLGSFQTWQAQLLTVPPYIVGFFAAISASWFSDRWAKVHGDEPTFKASRAWQLGLAFTLTLIGVSVWAAGVSGWAGYAAAFPLLAGNQAAVPIFWAYGAQHFFRGATGHSVGIAWVNSVGNLGGFAAPYFFFGTGQERLTRGFMINACVLSVGIALLALLEAIRLSEAQRTLRTTVSADEEPSKV